MRLWIRYYLYFILTFVIMHHGVLFSVRNYAYSTDELLFMYAMSFIAYGIIYSRLESALSDNSYRLRSGIAVLVISSLFLSVMLGLVFLGEPTLVEGREFHQRFSDAVTLITLAFLLGIIFGSTLVVQCRQERLRCSGQA